MGGLTLAAACIAAGLIVAGLASASGASAADRGAKASVAIALRIVYALGCLCGAKRPRGARGAARLTICLLGRVGRVLLALRLWRAIVGLVALICAHELG